MPVANPIRRMIEQKRRYRAFARRRDALPSPYRDAVAAVETYLWNFASGRDDSLLPLMEDLADLFEQSAAHGTPLTDVTGEDPVEFAETLLANYPGQQWILKARTALRNSIGSLSDTEESA